MRDLGHAGGPNLHLVSECCCQKFERCLNPYQQPEPAQAVSFRTTWQAVGCVIRFLTLLEYTDLQKGASASNNMSHRGFPHTTEPFEPLCVEYRSISILLKTRVLISAFGEQIRVACGWNVEHLSDDTYNPLVSCMECESGSL